VTIDLQVAVKEFLKIDDFRKENEVLQQINDLHHPHIIRHFASIDKGKRGYIIFPWADGGNLHDFWMYSDEEASPERTLWSLRQISGLTSAVKSLHERFNCRHGDLKPENILCITESKEKVLKIADFGVSKVHHSQTISRKKATTCPFLTPSYQGPEVEFDNLKITDQQPRSRKYDIWSLACVFLEFSIWLLHGPEAVEKFAGARGNGTQSTSTPLYEVTDRAKKAVRVHKLVDWTIVKLEDHPQCKEETALAALLSLIKDQMLRPVVEDRPSAAEICKKLECIVKKAEESPSYLFSFYDGIHIPPIDFEEFQWGPD
jgi:serine/threonine protein kinase